MARSFSGASGQHLDLASAPATAAGFSIGCWFKTSSFADRVLVSIGSSGTTNHAFSLRIDSSGHVIARTRTTGNADAITSTTASSGTYAFALGVWAASNDRRAYLNGAGKVTEITNRVPSGISLMKVGTETDDSSARMNGLIAHVCIWNTALSDADATSLAGGANPQTIQAANLIDYWTLDTNASPEVAVVGSSLTVTGTTYSSTNPTVATVTTAALTGQAAAFSIGSVTSTRSMALTGQALTSAIGTVTGVATIAGKQSISVSGLPWLAGEYSFFQGANPPIVNGDVALVDLVTIPGGYTFNLSPTGVPSYDSGGDTSRQSVVLEVFSSINGSYGQVTEYINNSPPQLTPQQSYVASFTLNQAGVPFDLTQFATDPEGDAMVITVSPNTTHALPAGLSFDGSVVTGTPTVLGTTAVVFRWTDITGEYMEQTFTFEVSPDLPSGVPSVPYLPGIGGYFPGVGVPR